MNSFTWLAKATSRRKMDDISVLLLGQHTTAPMFAPKSGALQACLTYAKKEEDQRQPFFELKQTRRLIWQRIPPHLLLSSFIYLFDEVSGTPTVSREAGSVKTSCCYRLCRRSNHKTHPEGRRREGRGGERQEIHPKRREGWQQLSNQSGPESSQTTQLVCLL